VQQKDYLYQWKNNTAMLSLDNVIDDDVDTKANSNITNNSIGLIAVFLSQILRLWSHL
jgi:hypothetical protein